MAPIVAADAGPAVPSVVRPRMFYLPGVMKRWDAAFYAAAVGKAIRVVRRTSAARLIDAHFVWPDGVGASWWFGQAHPIVMDSRSVVAYHEIQGYVRDRAKELPDVAAPVGR